MKNEEIIKNQKNSKNENSDSDSEHDSDILKNSKLMNSLKNSGIDLNKTVRQIEVLPENIDKADLSFKLIVIGDSFVGKSSLANKAVKNKFETGYSATLGFDYFSFFCKIEDKILKLQIWDTCGQEIYQSLITNFYRNSSLAIMVYSITNRESFEHIDNWLKEIKVNSNPDAKIFLIGNKNDLEEERKVSYQEGKDYADEMEFSKFLECSAKTGFNAQEIFIEAANMLYDDYNDLKATHSFNTSSVSEKTNGSQILTKLNNTNNTNKNTNNSVKEKKKKECC